MRTKIFNLAALVLLAAACSSNESELTRVENHQETALVRVSFNDFSMAMSEVAGARAATRSEEVPAS